MARRPKVDWFVCRARGLCFELLREAIDLDEGGYPMVTAEIPPELLRAAREAVRSCPTLALRLVDDAHR